MNKKLEKEIRDLADKCMGENEGAAAIVLYALLGSYTGKVEAKFANKVKEYVNDVLIPDMDKRISDLKARKN